MKLFFLPIFCIITTTEAFHIVPRNTSPQVRTMMMMMRRGQQNTLLHMVHHHEQNIGSGMLLEHVHILIDKMDPTNYKESLEMIEPFLLNEANHEEYEDAMRKLNRKAHHLNIDIPHEYATDKRHHPPFHLHGGDESMEKTAGSGMQLQHVDLLIDHLTVDNFAASLDMIEPFLINEADELFLVNALERIETKAKVLGKSIPKDYGEKIHQLRP